jgi:hypothetical protein
MINYITHIKDVLGNNYLGINIQKEVVDPFLVELKEILSEDNYEKFTDYQQKRDSGKWHITVINTMDYNRLSKEMGIDRFINSLDLIFKYPIDDLKMLGIGTAERNSNRAYFIVCRSEKLDALRKRFNLPKHDFHVTLGFFSKDVFGVPKNEIIKKEGKFLKLLRQEFNKEDSWGFVRRVGNFDLNPKSELIPISISNTLMKFKCDDYYLDIGWLDGDQKFWIMSKYTVEEELPRMPETEISKIINK